MEATIRPNQAQASLPMPVQCGDEAYALGWGILKPHKVPWQGLMSLDAMADTKPVIIINITVIFMDITKCSLGVPSFSNKKISTDPNSNFQLGLGMYYTYVRMYDR